MTLQDMSMGDDAGDDR